MPQIGLKGLLAKSSFHSLYAWIEFLSAIGMIDMLRPDFVSLYSIAHTLDYRARKVFIKISRCRMPEKRAEKERWIYAGYMHLMKVSFSIVKSKNKVAPPCTNDEFDS
jgi:hypothetical protein